MFWFNLLLRYSFLLFDKLNDCGMFEFENKIEINIIYNVVIFILKEGYCYFYFFSKNLKNERRLIVIWY